MARTFGFADGKVVGRAIKAEARKLYPNDLAKEEAHILDYLSKLLAENKNPYGKPWTASFWRGLGTGLGR